MGRPSGPKTTSNDSAVSHRKPFGAICGCFICQASISIKIEAIESDVSARWEKARGVSEKTRKGGPPPESVELGSTEPPGEVRANTAWVNLPVRLGPTQHWSMKECEFSETHFELKTSLLPLNFKFVFLLILATAKAKQTLQHIPNIRIRTMPTGGFMGMSKL